MGSDQCTRTRLFTRCCQGASFGFGLVLTVLTIAVMFWIAWCYFGLTIIQLSDSQRRAIVNYSYTSSKPLPTPTPASSSRSTTLATDETSINSISKSPTTASILRGSSRGESQVKLDKKKEAASVSSLAKGDFANRDRATHDKNVTALPSKDVQSSEIPSSRGSSKDKNPPNASSGETAAILTGSESDESDDRIHARRQSSPGSENRPEEIKGSASASRPDIVPTKVYDSATVRGSSIVEDPVIRPVREEERTKVRDYEIRDKDDPPRRDEIQSSRRSDPDSVYRDPDFDREYPRRSDRERSRYDDMDEDSRSRGRYDKRDRGRESDDRYSKGDTRVYPDDRSIPRSPEDRYRDRERYPDDPPRRGDDDKYDDRVMDGKSRIRDATRYRDRDLDRTYVRDDRDDDRYRSTEKGRYVDRDDDKYRGRDEDRYRDRDDDRYRSRDDDRYRSRDDDKYRSRDDDRYRTRDDDRYKTSRGDAYVSRDDDRYRDETRYRARDDDRYIRDPDDRKSIPSRAKDEVVDRYRPRTDDIDYGDSPRSRVRETDLKESVSRGSGLLPVGDRKSSSSRTDYDVRVEDISSDYDIPARDRPRSPVRDDDVPPRIVKPVYDDERYRDRDDRIRRPTQYGDEVIAPTRTRDDIALTKSPYSESRPKIVDDEARYVGVPKDRIRDDPYYDRDDRIRDPGLQGSRSAVPARDSSRRYVDDSDKYRTRTPNERIEEPKISDRRDEVVLDRRSYASDDDEEYRRRGSKTPAYDDRTRSAFEEPRSKYRDDEGYPLRDPVVDDDYKSGRPRVESSRDRSKSRDRYDDDEYRTYDDRYVSRDKDRYVPTDDDVYPSRRDRQPVPARKYDDDLPVRREPDARPVRREDTDDRVDRVRPSSSFRDEVRSYGRDDISESKSSSRRRYDDELPRSDDRDYRDSDDRRYSGGSRIPLSVKETVIGPSMSSISSREPSDVVIREKRFPSTDTRNQNSRMPVDATSGSEMRPLSAKDVIETAIRQSDNSDQNSRKVYYPVFDPRASNLTSPEIIRPSERRGTIITAKRKRSV